MYNETGNVIDKVGVDVVDVVKISGEAAYLKALVDVGPISVLFFSTNHFENLLFYSGIYDSDHNCGFFSNKPPGKLNMFHFKKSIS